MSRVTGQATTASVEKVTLDRDVTTERTMCVWSIIVTTEAPVWLTALATDVNVSWAPLAPTVKRTTEMSACTTHVVRMADVLTRQETMTASVRQSGEARTVMSMTSPHQVVLMPRHLLVTLADILWWIMKMNCACANFTDVRRRLATEFVIKNVTS